MRHFFWLGLLFAVSASAQSDNLPLQPTLAWWNSFLSGGSVSASSNQVVAAGTDRAGNFYVAGSTNAVNFLTASATTQPPQANAGGAPLYRIDIAAGSAKKLYGLNTPTSIVANAQQVYATEGRRVWQSLDGGATWNSAPLFAATPDTITTFTAVDPKDSNTVYVSTTPYGIYKTSQGGSNWQAVNNGIPTVKNGVVNASRVWTDPLIPSQVFAATDQGLVRSVDGGANWTVLAPYPNIVQSLAFDPAHAGTVYIGIRGPLGTGIAKSVDSGTNFTLLSGAAVDAPSAIAIDPFRAGWLYAGTFQGLFQSTDGGTTWTSRVSGVCSAVVVDPANPVVYASVGNQVVRSSDGFATVTQLGSTVPFSQIVLTGSSLLALTAATTDAFITKFSPSGDVIYSTYLGGSGQDSATGMAVAPDGTVYVVGTTASQDFPVTANVYQSTATSTLSNFLAKLNPDGSLGWATYFAKNGTTANTVAVDAQGNPYVGGTSSGGLPTTPGAYQTSYTQTCTRFCISAPGFVTKFNATGSALIYSTYLATDTGTAVFAGGQAIVVDSQGNAYVGGNGGIAKVNPTGSAVLGSTHSTGSVAALALDAAGNVYASGSASPVSHFPSTPGAFQTISQPVYPALPYQATAGGDSDAFVSKFDPTLSQLLAATLLGGELADAATSIVIDPSNRVVISGYTDSRRFPTMSPRQTTFAIRTGFLAELSNDLSQLLLSTYLGDTHPFEAQAVVSDSQGNLFLAGSTLLTPIGSFNAVDQGDTLTNFDQGVVNRILIAPAQPLRIDSVVNFASRLAAPLSPGELVTVTGSGFGSDASLLLDGSPLPLLSTSATTLVAAIPDGAKTAGTFQLQVTRNGVQSNLVQAPAAPASPGIFSLDGTGVGQGLILNADGSQNSPTNPAAPGSQISIFITGTSPVSTVGGYAVTTLPPSVFVEFLYANGIAAALTTLPNVPGKVYRLDVYVPDPVKLAINSPNFVGFKFPPQVGVQVAFGPTNPLNPAVSTYISQIGLLLNVAQ